MENEVEIVKYMGVEISISKLTDNRYRWVFDVPTWGGGSIRQTFDALTRAAALNQAYYQIKLCY